MDYAFPCVHDIQPEKPGGRSISVEQGMTLRDYFAAKAMQGYLIGGVAEEPWTIAEDAYEQADAMLKARQA